MASPDSISLDEPGLVHLAGAMARHFAHRMAPNDTVFIGLSGDLGVGKTTFVRGFVSGLSAEAGLDVTSPTFALVHRYECSPPVWHLDLYRLAPDDLMELGPDELFYQPGFVLVEWAERAAAVCPRDRVELDLTVESDERRTLKWGVPEGWRSEALLAALRTASD
ncbi:MAG: tRNA (adenosine(37)-N6)-threonylcarbamoyltransferase complex ATPase subunit type 1 TsaE [Myxococcota bacterium]